MLDFLHYNKVPAIRMLQPLFSNNNDNCLRYHQLVRALPHPQTRLLHLLVVFNLDQQQKNTKKT